MLRLLLQWVWAGLPSPESEAVVRQIRSLDVDEARHRAIAALANPERFTCQGPTPETSPDQSLPPGARAFFAAYPKIQVVGFDTWISGTDVAAATRGTGFLRIGYAHFGGDHIEVAMREGDERVFELPDHGETAATIVNESWPSLHHWVLYQDSLFDDEK